MTPSPVKAEAAAPAAASRGAFILFEGIDRCGKTTQAQALVNNLRAAGVDAELWRFPDRTTAIGQMIDGYLQSRAELEDHAVHLLFAANRWEKSQEMAAKLAAGTTLVVDRFSFSGVAFSSAKGLDRRWCEAQEVGLPAPDAVVYLRLSVEDAAARGGYGQERYEKDALQCAVLAQFDAWAADSALWTPVPALQTREAIAAQVLRVAQEAVARCRAGAPLGTMWGALRGGKAAGGVGALHAIENTGGGGTAAAPPGKCDPLQA